MRWLSALLLGLAMVPAPVSAQVHVATEGTSQFSFPEFDVPQRWAPDARNWYEDQLWQLQADPRLRARLTWEERRTLAQVELVYADTDKVIFAAEVRDGPDKITLSAGGAYFLDLFARILGGFEQNPDFGMIYHFLSSERARERGERRWFDPMLYHQWKSTLPPVPNPLVTSTIQSSGRIMAGFILLHELCHLFRQHDESAFEGMPREEQLPIRRDREIEADQCAADHLLAMDGNPYMGLMTGLAYSATASPIDSLHPSSEERRRRMILIGNQAVQRFLSIGYLTAAQADSGFQFAALFERVLIALDQEDLAAEAARAAARAAARQAERDSIDDDDDACEDEADCDAPEDGEE